MPRRSFMAFEVIVEKSGMIISPLKNTLQDQFLLKMP